MNYVKLSGYYLLISILIIFISSILNLIGVNSTITNLILFIYNLIIFFIMGLKMGKKCASKGYLAGLKIGLVLILILFIINLITIRKIFNITTIIYYLVLILSSITGGMLGINKKDKS